ncbi:hypothetical protein NIA71_09900 [Ihubacter massiliensis]|uniref:Type 4 fimbrial biogenesis protein PilX N-terminal domain-containing protein n=1 Tax=Hominibacterium faecale TaxID=2839743 RepID=A0A9J6QX64_9FIRM|nr:MULTISPECIES: hypothetical protein [Eubacteriales Family XIII. Incertae Sedis]MCC2865977.1 hypothetical protein [Anaerovorax odorimutans]MCI7302912.1 hypothetical protein [Clostridia bacterium]MDY3012584.1 hypothetical protein [Clostridiales Family XIII bacterium]MCO7122254.1 hypothetical protein [Ihubacter massiliensis]MCU7380084.1 hypothetical protein [Hominibacterium faecale]
MAAKYRCRLIPQDSGKKGYTLIIAVIIMAVLLIVGTAVLTAAANSLNTVNRRVEGRQTYYVAKSAMNVIDQSMHGRELGILIRNKAYSAVSGRVAEINDTVTLPAQELSVESIQLTGDGLSDYSIENMEVRYTPSLTILGKDGTSITRARLALSDLTIQFTAKFGKNTYRLKAVYAYDGIVTISADKKMWEQETWVTESVSQ